MRLTSSTHNHTNLCDGRNTPEEMARAALEAGFTDFGFSGHSYAPFDLDYSVKSEQHYVQELRALQKAYAGRLRIAVGMEADWFAPVNDRAALDYIIGSVHYLRDEATGRYYAVDGAPEALDACVTQMFGGDALAMARAYYALVAENVRKYRPEIIGDQREMDKIAELLHADALFILTAVDRVAINWGKPDQKSLEEMSIAEAEKYIGENQFAPGSMLPKVQAAMDFAASDAERTAMITLLEKAKDGILGKTGTRIHM